MFYLVVPSSSRSTLTDQKGYVMFHLTKSNMFSKIYLLLCQLSLNKKVSTIRCMTASVRNVIPDYILLYQVGPVRFPTALRPACSSSEAHTSSAMLELQDHSSHSCLPCCLHSAGQLAVGPGAAGAGLPVRQPVYLTKFSRESLSLSRL